MKVILLEDVKGSGKKGAVIDVTEGHGRNFLIPRKLAAEATKANIAEHENRMKQREHKKQQELIAAQELAARLRDISIKLAVRVGENGKMFGSISNKEIAEALLSQADIAVDKKKIVLSEPVKAVGQYKAVLKLHAQVSAPIAFEVTAEQ